MFKSNLNEISRGGHKQEEQKSSLQSTHYKVLSHFTKHEKMSLNYLMIILQLHEAKYKAIHGKGCPSMLASRLSDLAFPLKILTLKVSGNPCNNHNPTSIV